MTTTTPELAPPAPRPLQCGAFYRFAMGPQIDLTEAEATLHLAIIAVEGLAGSATVRLDAAYTVDPEARTLIIDATTPVGMALARVFTHLLATECGGDSFEVRPLPAQREGRSS